MNRFRQQGAATLVVTSVLLVVALVVTMGTHKSLFYQIKRSQNEVKSRQNHWLAEGAIECAYAQFRENNKIPEVITDCGSGQGVIASYSPTAYGYRVSARSGYSSVEKQIQITHGLKRGAIQSSSDLYFHSSATISTPDPGLLSERGWECIALRYSNRIHVTNLHNKGVLHGHKPYENFSNPGGKDCLPSHLTNSAVWYGLRSDVVKDTNLSLFEQFFNVPAELHDKVKQREQITVIEGVGFPKVVRNCGRRIANHIRAGHLYLWIEGGCEIKSSEYNDLVNASSLTDGVLLLVHEGNLSLMGKPLYRASSQMFKGVLFHFNREFSPHLSKWRGFEALAFLAHNPAIFDDSYRYISSYYQHGAFTFSGGQYFDTPGQAAIFYDSLDFNFNGDVVDSILANVNTPKWKQGSWYAE